VGARRSEQTVGVAEWPMQWGSSPLPRSWAAGDRQRRAEPALLWQSFGCRARAVIQAPRAGSKTKTLAPPRSGSRAPPGDSEGSPPFNLVHPRIPAAGKDRPWAFSQRDSACRTGSRGLARRHQSVGDALQPGLWERSRNLLGASASNSIPPPLYQICPQLHLIGVAFGVDHQLVI